MHNRIAPLLIGQMTNHSLVHSLINVLDYLCFDSYDLSFLRCVLWIQPEIKSMLSYLHLCLQEWFDEHRPAKEKHIRGRRKGIKLRKTRTIFSSEQIQTLEALFARCSYYSRPETTSIGENIGLDHVTVKVGLRSLFPTYIM
jgi:hypothetical protein